MKFPKYFYTIFAVLLITGVLFSGCGQTDTTQPNNLTPTSTQESVTPPSTPTQENTEISSSTEESMESTQETSESTPTQQTNETSTSQTTQETKNTVSYKNGTYSESALYDSPAGTEDVSFDFTVTDNALTEIQIISSTKNPMSQKFQGFFLEGIKKEVIGKKLDDIGTFTRVNGSSLTPGAFNEALSSLKKEAQA